MAHEVGKDEAPLVDSHFHVWNTELPLVDAAWHKKVADATHGQLLKLLDDHGITFGVIAAASLYGTFNDYSREALKKSKRLRATCIVDPRTDIYQLRQMKDDGFVGIRLVWHHLDEVPNLNSDEYRHLLKRVADLDWCVHFIDREPRIQSMIENLEKFGVRKIVVDHLGRIDNPEGINSAAFKAVAAAVDRGKTWVKLSGGFRFKPGIGQALAKELVRITGGDRMMFGSDWPFAAYEDKTKYIDTLNFLKECVPDERIRRKIGGDTPLKFYFT